MRYSLAAAAAAALLAGLPLALAAQQQPPMDGARDVAPGVMDPNPEGYRMGPRRRRTGRSLQELHQPNADAEHH